MAHKWTRPYTSRTNGKVERFNATLAREWAYGRENDSGQARQAALGDFLTYYNPRLAPRRDRPPGSGQPSPATRLPTHNRRAHSLIPADDRTGTATVKAG
ncbi:integrase core domain-containing protein [Nocardia carnea]|uniref:Integrase core domain-containing protein n=1 Tax=Nocardia carnea TaxID=37328 RepID=A0ABW7TUH7_9NOCA